MNKVSIQNYPSISNQEFAYTAPDMVFNWNQSPQGLVTIRQAKFMRFSLLRALTVFPLAGICSGGIAWLLAINSSRMLAFLLYEQTSKEECQYILVQGVDRVSELQPVRPPNQWISNSHFYFRKVPYFLNLQTYLPWRDGWGAINNQHQLAFQGLHIYLLRALGTPLFIYQLITCAINILNQYYLSAVVMLVGSILTLLGTWIIMFFNFSKLKKISQLSYEVQTSLGTKFNFQLRSGQVWLPRKGEVVPADCLLIQGQIYVDQSNLTGQAIPIYKKPFKKKFLGQIKQINKLFQGSIVIEASQQCQATVVLTGFQTRKGRSLRGLLKNSQDIPSFMKESLFFQLAVFLPFLIAFVSVMYKIFYKGLFLVLTDMFFILSIIVPPYLPIYFNFVFSVSLLKLKMIDIFSTSPSKTLAAGNLRTICFDKTGTLTTKKLHLESIQAMQEQRLVEYKQAYNQILQMAMGTCHSCIPRQCTYIGDQIQTQVLLNLKGKYLIGDTNYYLNIKGQKAVVIKRFQFDNMLRMMSVVVKKQNKYWLFCKGAPIDMLNISTVGLGQRILIENAISTLNKKGLRNLIYCCRSLENFDSRFVHSQNRYQFQKGLQFCAILAFSHQIESSAETTVKNLKQANIEMKIISGDDATVTAVIGKRVGIVQGNLKYIFQSGQIEQKDQLYCQARDIDTISQELFSRVKVFGRASPIDKAKIIRKIQYLKNCKHQSFCNQLSYTTQSVGMVGDGANDVLAILEADVGIGISGCQSSYGASFAINEINGVLDIVIQGKATVANLMDASRFFVITNSLNCLIKMVFFFYKLEYKDAIVVWLSYPTSLFIILTFAFGKGNYPITKYFISQKFFTILNFISIIAHFLVALLGIVAILLYCHLRLGYESNFQEQVYTSTLIYYTSVVILLPPILITGTPYKQNFYCNKILLLVLFITLSLNAVIFFSSDNFLYLFVFGMTKWHQEARFVIGIIIIASILFQFIVKKLINCMLQPDN